MNATNVHKLFITISIASFLVGFSGLGGPITGGLGRAVGGIFFILFFIFLLLRNEKTDGELRAESDLHPVRTVSRKKKQEHPHREAREPAGVAG